MVESHPPAKQKGPGRIALIPLIALEAASGLEPERSGFAGRCLTTWLCRHIKTEQESDQAPQRSLPEFFQRASAGVVSKPPRRRVAVTWRFRLGASYQATSRDFGP